MNRKKSNSKISIIGGIIAIVCALISLVVEILIGEMVNPVVDVTLLVVGCFLIFSGIRQKNNKE